MKDLLRELTTYRGVHAVFVCDHDGRQMAAVTSDRWDQNALKPLIEIITRTNSTLGSLKHGRLAEIEWVYSGGRALVRGIGDGLLCLICDRSINLQLLTMKIEQVQEEILSIINSKPREPSSADIQQLKDQMINTAQEMLGEHAEKVIAILSSSDNSLTGLESACNQAEKVTHLFIDRKKAGELGARMQALLDGFR
jgi:predicted regulator of Ras-like GTPase activity (Roadblock/LC7/MglB family)